MPQTAQIGVIRCQCDGKMQTTDREETPRGTLHTVECMECREVGGYNGETLATYGAVDSLELIGE